jgi:molybdopterin-guanine dinucleotide biosynthesis protein A
MLTAAILAGGKSSRMGVNKAVLPFRGKPMIHAVIEAVRPLATEIILVSDDATPYASLGLRTVPDVYRGRGPLGGLHAALRASRTEETFLLSCDIPRVSIHLLRYIADHPSVAPARVPELCGRVHPLCGVYDARCLPEIDRLIAADRLAMAALLDAVGAAAIPIHPGLPWYDPGMLVNINDPAALRAGEAA